LEAGLGENRKENLHLLAGETPVKLQGETAVEAEAIQGLVGACQGSECAGFEFEKCGSPRATRPCGRRGFAFQIRTKSGEADAFITDEISPRKAAPMEPDDQFANFRGAAAPFDWERLLHGGKNAAVSRSEVDADSWANTFKPRPLKYGVWMW